MSEVKNCLTCRWEPEWNDEDIPYGACRWKNSEPLPVFFDESQGIKIINDARSTCYETIHALHRFANCPAYQRRQIAMPETKNIEQRVIWWLLNGKTGVSSKTICAVMLGAVDASRDDAWCKYSHPHDPSDFSRCHALLELIPEWRTELYRVAEVFPAWTGLVERWVELEVLYAAKSENGRCMLLYRRMRELIDAHQPRGGGGE